MVDIVSLLRKPKQKVHPVGNGPEDKKMEEWERLDRKVLRQVTLHPHPCPLLGGPCRGSGKGLS